MFKTNYLSVYITDEKIVASEIYLLIIAYPDWN